MSVFLPISQGTQSRGRYARELLLSNSLSVPGTEAIGFTDDNPQGPSQCNDSVLVEFEPPLIVCVVSSRILALRRSLKTIRECVIAVSALKLADKAVQVGNTSGRDIGTFAAFGLTSLPARPLCATDRRLLRQLGVQGGR